MIGYENQLFGLSKTDFVTYSNEHSTTKNNKDVRKSLKYFQKQSDLTSNNIIECSDIVGSSYNQVLVTRLEDDLNNIIHLSNNSDSSGLECNSEIDSGECCNLVFITKKEKIMTKRIDISDKTDEIVRRNGRMGETHDDVIFRVFSASYACDHCCNLE